VKNDHRPVLLTECLDALSIRPGGIYIDGTFGRGGHSQAILDVLDENGQLIAIDQDMDAISFAHKEFANEPRFKIVHQSFAAIKTVAEERDVMGKVDGILLDLGVSSPQLDNQDRGFSFLLDGPLDMRMDTTKGQSAKEWVNEAKEADIATVLKEYGEERFAKRMARAICAHRESTPFTTTKELADVVTEANPKWEKHKHPATRAFQAIRIFINRELEAIDAFFADVLAVLAPGGRLAVISFHSLEDRRVKRFMRAQSKVDTLPRKLPVLAKDMAKAPMKLIGKAIKPRDSEIDSNVRARSAVLRVGERVL